MNYNKLVERCFFHPEHVGSLDPAQPDTVVSRIGDKTRGASFDLYVSCGPGGEIREARFQARGNPYVIAGLEWLCAQLQGSLIARHPRLDYHEIVRQLSIPRTQYPVAVLIERAYRSVIQQMNDRLKGNKDE